MNMKVIKYDPNISLEELEKLFTHYFFGKKSSKSPLNVHYYPDGQVYVEDKKYSFPMTREQWDFIFNKEQERQKAETGSAV